MHAEHWFTGTPLQHETRAENVKHAGTGGALQVMVLRPGMKSIWLCAKCLLHVEFDPVFAKLGLHVTLVALSYAIVTEGAAATTLAKNKPAPPSLKLAQAKFDWFNEATVTRAPDTGDSAKKQPARPAQGAGDHKKAATKATPRHATPPPKKTATSGEKKPADKKAASKTAWAVTCSDQPAGQFVCQMTQTVLDQKSRRQLLLLSIKKAKDIPANVMLFRLPHGIYLPTGLTVRIDNGNTSKLPFQKSDRTGVYAALPLTDKLINDMKRGRKIIIGAALNKGQHFKLSGALTGFTKAYDRINALN